MHEMETIIVLIAITVQIKMISGVGNETIMVKEQKGETVVLKCSSSEGVSTWLGPDVNNAEQGIDVYFLNNEKNPKLNITKYSLQEKDGGYDLTIVNFLEENAGCYICRYKNDGMFYETKYDVSLIDLLPSTTVIYDEGGNTLPDNATVYATSTTILLEDLSYDIRTLIWVLCAFFIFIKTATCTAVLSSKLRRYGHVIHIAGPNVHVPSVPIYYSAPESENNRHIYDQSIPQYREVIDSEEQYGLSDLNRDESRDEIIITVLDQNAHDYEEIQ